MIPDIPDRDIGPKMRRRGLRPQARRGREATAGEVLAGLGCAACGRLLAAGALPVPLDAPNDGDHAQRVVCPDCQAAWHHQRVLRQQTETLRSERSQATDGKAASHAG
jgi:hypothetical protein